MSSAFTKALQSIDREAWKRFLIAVFGLIVALGSALLSTSFRENGNLWATAISASAALLIAGWVAIATVPYLARRVAVERWVYSLNYDVTREGAAYLGLVLMIGIAALNTGNNLLFLVVSAMLAAIIVSGLLSAEMLRGLELEVSIPEDAFAGRALAGRITLHNRRRLLPTFSVSVIPAKKKKRFAGRKWQRGVFGFPFKRPPHQQWLRLPDLQWNIVPEPARAPEIFEQPAYFPHIAAKTSASVDMDLNFPRRGRYLQQAIGISTRFPFSFLIKTRRVPLQREIIVYPSVEPTDEFFEVLPMITGEFETFVPGRGYELYRIRNYLPQDTARHVDWKATAKSGTLKVREFSREDERKLRIVFDNPAPGTTLAEAYEDAIALAASLAWHFADGYTELAFSAQGFAESGGIHDFLEYLALVSPQHAPSVIDALPVTEHYNLIFTTRPQGSIPTALWTSSYFIFIDGVGGNRGRQKKPPQTIR